MNAPGDIKAHLREAALALGFHAFGVAPANAPLPREHYLDWLARGCHGPRRWLERDNDVRLHPANFLPGARSIVMVGLNPAPAHPPRPYRIARYAIGADYHDVLGPLLEKLSAEMTALGGEQRCSVDNAPVMEKPLAVCAGLGWQGRNTLLINPRHGSRLMLGAVFTTLELPPDEPAANACGTCARCLDACPTRALAPPGQLDTRRCLSGLNQQGGSIPVEFRPLMGDRVFGCDACQDACPWNRRADADAAPSARQLPANLRDTLAWTEADFARNFAGTPVERLGLRRWLRNVCVVLGNTGDAEDLPALRLLAAHRDPMLAEHATWAVAQLAQRAAVRD